MAARKTYIPSRYFAKVTVEFDDDIALNRVGLKQLLSSSVKQLFGLLGQGAYEIDIIEYNEETLTGIVCFQAEALVPVRSSLFFLQSFDSHVCRVNVATVSPFLASLAHDAAAWMEKLDAQQQQDS